MDGKHFFKQMFKSLNDFFYSNFKKYFIDGKSMSQLKTYQDTPFMEK